MPSLATLGFAALLALGTAPLEVGAAPLERFEFAEPHMGTTFRIVLFAGDSAQADRAAAAAFAVVADLDARLSDWAADSELSRLGEVAGTGEGREVSRELWEALSLAHDWARRTGGAFDPTVGPLTRLWRWSARRGELPDPARLAAARAAVGWEQLRLERADGARVVRLERPGMALDLGGIAKGIAADAALAELARCGVRSALVDAGGDIATGAAPPGEDGWRIGSGGESGSETEGTLVLGHAGIATSGAAHRYFEVDGVRYSHILDPRTGLGVTEPGAVTVIARDAATADVLASALSVMDEAAGRALVASVPGARIVAGPRPHAGRSNPPSKGARP